MINCYMDYCVENPFLLLIIIPIILLLVILLFRDFIKFKNIEEKKRFRRKKLGMRIILLITRTLILFLILVAISNPFQVRKEIVEGDPIIRLLIDNTESMDVFEEDILEKAKKKLSGMELEIQQISSGKTSNLGDGILKQIRGNDNLLVISDGNNNLGKSLLDVGLYSRVSNSRLFGLNMEPIKNDAYVTITGPSETIQGTQNRFKVNVDYIGSQPSFTLQIYVDDKLEFSGNNIFEKELIKSFGEGYHRVTAKILNNDFFEENNIFYKTVKAVKKPRILFVSKRGSPLTDGLGKIYDFNLVSKLPSDLSSYSAIVFNDIPYSDIVSRINDLTGMLIDGKGIVFIGGRTSFDKGGYKGTLLESMLPVTMGTGKTIAPLDNNIVIVLDVSESFSDYSFKEGGKNSALDFGKGLAVKMIDDFRDDIKVGVVAFASIGQIVNEPVLLKDNREMLKSKIERLRKGEGTSIDQGLIMAEYALEQTKGTKNVILISDGKMGHIELPNAPISVASRMGARGVRIYTVGLPSELYDVDVNRKLMTKLADEGHGSYFEPNEFQFLNVFFGKPEAKDKIFSGSSNLAVIDKEHFITRDIGISGRITGVNFVLPKLGSKNLIFTGDGNPVLNSWNFGLGRVVTMATDDGSQWAGSLLNAKNSILFTRMINYAVGNPERNKELYVEARDGFLGGENSVSVRSTASPVSKDLTFIKTGDGLYKANFNPSKADYYQFFDALIAINQPREYFDLGMSDELKEMVDVSGGKMLNLNDKNIIEQIKTYSKREEFIRKDLKIFPVGILLGLFIIELILRKVFKRTKG